MTGTGGCDGNYRDGNGAAANETVPKMRVQMFTSSREYSRESPIPHKLSIV